MTTEIASKGLTQTDSSSILDSRICSDAYTYDIVQVRVLLENLFDTSVGDSDQRADVAMAVARLEPEQKRIVVLKASGYAEREIAKRLHVHRNTVTYRWHRTVLSVYAELNGGE